MSTEGGINISGTASGRDFAGRDIVHQYVLPDSLELSGSRLPQRNPLFVGREDTFSQLAGRLNADGALVILTGYGGLGKTQTAVEFGHRFAAQYPGGVFYLRCDQPELISGEVAACGAEGRIPFLNYGSLPRPDQVALVQREWGKPIPRLLIFDNVEDKKVLKRWRPTTGGCRMLVTARRAHWPPTLTPHVFALPQLARADSLKLLAHGRGDLFAHDADANTLADMLGDLPLALHVAGAYIAHYGLTPAQYLAELRERSSALEHESLQDWLKDELPTEHIPNVAATFEVSYRKLTPIPSPSPEAGEGSSAPPSLSGKGAGGLGLKLFHLLAHCAPAAPLPREVLMKAVVEKEKEKERKKELTDALHALADVGLVVLDSDLRPITHRLLQEFARLRAPTPNADAERMEEVVGSMAARINEGGLPRAMEPLALHLQTLAARAEARGSENAGLLFNELGYHLNMIADYPAARAAYDRALAMDEKTFGADHPNAAIRVNNLGMVHQALGDLPAARAAFERALAIWEKALGADRSNVASAVNNLGSVLQDMGDLPAARAAFERALAIDEKTFGSDHPEVATDVNNLGVVYQALGTLPAARAAYERALKIYERYAPNSRETKIIRENLAGVAKEMMNDEG